MSTELHGKVAVVTGGSKGIGFAIAAALAAQGAGVVISGRDSGALEQGRERLAGMAGPDRIAAVQADVRRPDAVDHLMAAAVATFGGLDILVNNAGVGRFSDVADQSIDDWQAVIETNLSGVFFCCRTAIPHLRRRGGGWIINISSLAGRNSFKMAAAYCASKAGLNAFSEALMQEVRYDNIRVSYVMPGSVRTGFGGNDDEDGADWKLDPEDVAEVVVDLIRHPARSLPSRVEIRPSRPRR
ncbi:MAG TPA: SDR family oxidoreductase [Vicinamibacterales bacterium]|nr:SDR family oxidoreductase [Vicinamibacterales bacterium]